MLKVTIPKIVLMILTFVFCLHLSGLTVAEECWDSEGGGPTFSGNHNYPSGWFPEFQYDPDNPDVIDQNNSIEIKVIGGIPPYTWQVSGNGFSLSEGATKGLTNNLIANDIACGTATITVTDKRGDSCTGYVRCTEGQWVLLCEASESRCAGDVQEEFYEYPDGQTQLKLEVGCYYCPADCACIYKSCEGYTAYIPESHSGICHNPPYGDKYGTCEAPCIQGNCECFCVDITVYKWQCP